MTETMRKIIDYEIVNGTTDAYLEALVKCRLPDWQPLGNPFMGRDECYYQVMVRYEEEPKADIDYRSEYLNLIDHVRHKIPGETRHETALRIIKEHETSTDACQAGLK